MGSKGQINISVTTISSPRAKGGKEDASGGGDDSGSSVNSPRGQLCLCSPTTHQGSFRCKFHRQGTKNEFSRSQSMPHTRNDNTNNASKLSLES
ncbi:hypothetical protein Hanom_Chr06g00520021 [Helianthus anomalus]